MPKDIRSHGDVFKARSRRSEFKPAPSLEFAPADPASGREECSYAGSVDEDVALVVSGLNMILARDQDAAFIIQCLAARIDPDSELYWRAREYVIELRRNAGRLEASLKRDFRAGASRPRERNALQSAIYSLNETVAAYVLMRYARRHAETHSYELIAGLAGAMDAKSADGIDANAIIRLCRLQIKQKRRLAEWLAGQPLPYVAHCA